MPLRESLRVRAPDAALVSRVEALVNAIVDIVESQGECSDLLAELERLTGCAHQANEFYELSGWTSVHEFAQRAALGPAPHVPDLTREELIDVVGLIGLAIAPEQRYYLDLFSRNVAHAAPTELIFHPGLHWPPGYEPTPEEIVDKAVEPGNVIHL